MTLRARAKKIALYYNLGPGCELTILDALQAVQAEADNFYAMRKLEVEKHCADNAYALGRKEALEQVAEMFKPTPYPDCPVQMTYQEAYDRIRVLADSHE